MRLLQSLALATPWLATALAVPTAECPLLGPMFPYDFDMLKYPSMQNAISSFPKAIESLFTTGAVHRAQTTFSIDVFSTVTNQSIYQYHHEAPGLNGTLSAGKLNDETVFRIGSVSKLFTSYSILASHGSLDILDHPVTKYLPELSGNEGSDPLEKIVYEDVTVGALMAQQGGTGGFPIAATSCYANSTCSNAEFLEIMRDHNSPVIPAFGEAIYSDAGFGILGRVLERVTGQSYNDALQSVLAEPLDLKSSATFEPTGRDVNAVILRGPVAVSSWGFDDQITAPSGGVYSNNADLRRLGTSILNSELLSPTQIREWMKPRAGVSSLSWLVGAPWEINRLALPVTANSTRTRISDLYTKTGGQSGYSAILALSPDHGIGFSVLLAGPYSNSDRWALRATVGEAFIVAAEWAAAENAAQNLAGTFVDEKAQGTNMTLSVDANHPGLGIRSLYIKGVESKSLILDPTGSLIKAGIDVSARLYPAGIETTIARDTKEVAFRCAAQALPIEPPAVGVDGRTGLFDDSCTTWLDVGFFKSAAGYGIDQFFFETVDGQLEKVTIPAVDVVMTRA